MEGSQILTCIVDDVGVDEETLQQAEGFPAAPFRLTFAVRLGEEALVQYKLADIELEVTLLVWSKVSQQGKVAN